MAKTEHYYGIHAVEALLETEPERVLTLFVQRGREDKRLQHVFALAQPFGISIQTTHKDRLEKLAGQPFHQGVVAAVRAHPSLNENDLLQLIQNKAKDCLILALDGVTDPHNLGACMRTAVAMGVDALLVPRDRSASLTPTARKIAAGAAEKIPFIQVTNLGKTLASLREQDFYVVGTLLDEQAKPIQQCSLTGNLVLVMGAEDTGIRPINQAQCDQKAFIPMYGDLQSLNVSVATGMALYEACRQRHTHTRLD